MHQTVYAQILYSKNSSFCFDPENFEHIFVRKLNLFIYLNPFLHIPYILKGFTYYKGYILGKAYYSGSNYLVINYFVN